MSNTPGPKFDPGASDAGRLPSPGDKLPPVESPDAGFILQLFVIPAIIVAIVAVVWLLFSWLAHMGSSPEKLVKGLEKLDGHSWQRAYDIARELGNPGNESLRSDSVMAGKLAALLDQQLGQHYPVGSSKIDTAQRKQAVQLRMYLCKALGEFEVADGVPALIRAATTERYVATDDNKDLGDTQVRQTSLEAIAVLAENCGTAEIRDHESLMSTVLEASSERSDLPEQTELRARLRWTAAYTLGVLGGDVSLDRLALLQSDAEVNVRCNAAIGLARNGDVRSIPGLLSMLDPDEVSRFKDFQRSTILVNAMRGVTHLAAKNDDADLSTLIETIESLAHGGQNSFVRARAIETLNELKRSAARQQ